METLTTLLIYACANAGTLLTGTFMAWLLTESPIRLGIKTKPFSCRPCMTFWCSFLFGLLVVYYGLQAFSQTITVSDMNQTFFLLLILVAANTLFSLINFFIIKSKTKIYD